MPARLLYSALNASVCGRSRAACSARCCAVGCITSALAVLLCSGCLGTVPRNQHGPFCRITPELWLATRASGRFPVPVLLSIQSRHRLLIPINAQLAGINPQCIMSLPALSLAPGPGQGDVVVVLTGHKPVTRDICSIDQVYLGEQGFGCQPVMNRLHGRDVLVRCWSRFDMGDDVRGFCVTRFGQMDLLSSPVMAPFFAVSDF